MKKNKLYFNLSLACLSFSILTASIVSYAAPTSPIVPLGAKSAGPKQSLAFKLNEVLQSAPYDISCKINANFVDQKSDLLVNVNVAGYYLDSKYLSATNFVIPQGKITTTFKTLNVNPFTQGYLTFINLDDQDFMNIECVATPTIPGAH